VSDSKTSYSQIIKTTSFWWSAVPYYYYFYNSDKINCNFHWSCWNGNNYVIKSTINVLSGISGLGIETSGIKHIASNYKNNDLSSVAKIATIVKKLAVFTGILGCLLTIFLSTWLSQLTLEIQIIAFFLFLLRYCSSS
jgi:hypothetical protein